MSPRTLWLPATRTVQQQLLPVYSGGEFVARGGLGELVLEPFITVKPTPFPRRWPASASATWW